MTTGKSKRLFISDIHMGDARSAVTSAANPYRYGWFLNREQDNGAQKPNQDRPAMLAGFLEQQVVRDTTVDELVILGDLFDEWVCPADRAPIEPGHTRQLEAVADAPQNAPVFAQLKPLAKSGRLVYVAGNHDMLGTKDRNRAFIEGCLDGVRYFGENGLGTYAPRDGIIAQHGHQYCLFNAPWTATAGTGFDASMLPMGFDLARLDAQFVGQKNRHYGFLDFLKDAVLQEFEKAGLALAISAVREEHEAVSREIGELVDKMIIDLFKTFHADAVFEDQAGVVYGGLDNVPGTIAWEAIEARYGAIFSRWAGDHPDNVSALKALINELGHLESGARHVLQDPARKVVIFGHTHIPDFKTYTVGGSRRLYANTGTWINEKDCTFVQTECDGRTHTVSVWEYKDNQPRPLPDSRGSVEI